MQAPARCSSSVRWRPKTHGQLSPRLHETSASCFCLTIVVWSLSCLFKQWHSQPLQNGSGERFERASASSDDYPLARTGRQPASATGGISWTASVAAVADAGLQDLGSACRRVTQCLSTLARLAHSRTVASPSPPPLPSPSLSPRAYSAPTCRPAGSLPDAYAYAYAYARWGYRVPCER